MSHLKAEYVARVVPTRNRRSHASMSAYLRRPFSYTESIYVNWTRTSVRARLFVLTLRRRSAQASAINTFYQPDSAPINLETCDRVALVLKQTVRAFRYLERAVIDAF